MNIFKKFIKIFDFDEDEDYSDIDFYEIDESDFLFF